MAEGINNGANIIIHLIVKQIKQNGVCKIEFERNQDPTSMSLIYNNGKLALQPRVDNPDMISLNHFKIKYSKYFSIDDSNNGMLIIASKISLCNDFLSDQRCNNCYNLHLCKYYLYGQCKFRNKCRYGHNLLDSYNQKILMKFKLYDCQWADIGKILRGRNDSMLQDMPKICRYYNSPSGCKKAAKNKCHTMHVCYKYMLDKCTYAKGCRYSHNIYDPQPIEILKKFHIDVERSPKLVLDEIRQQIAKDSDDVASITSSIRDDHSNDDVLSCENSDLSDSGTDFRYEKGIQRNKKENKNKTNELCTFYLRNKCTFDDKCSFIHSYKLPYLWKWCDKSIWVDFTEKECKLIEMKFCDVNSHDMQIRTASGIFDIQFEDMCYSLNYRCNGEIQRIGTKSHTNKDSFYEYLTWWNWYVGENNHWKNINLMDLGITSFELEEYTRNNKKVEYKNSFCSINLIKMKICIKNDMFLLRRRPELYKQNSSGQPLINILTNVNYPKTWNLDKLSDNNFFQTVKVERNGITSEEFKKIEQLFMKSMGKSIQMLHRVQNAQLWDAYQTKLKWMKNQRELSLFHFTKPEFIDSICQQGFDWRLTGNSAEALFGKGSYFSINASYSDRLFERYSEENGMRKLIVARVLVGEYCVGKIDYMRPPPIYPHLSNGCLYDSCVNDEANPTIFVVFDHNQAYPDYVITY